MSGRKRAAQAPTPCSFIEFNQSAKPNYDFMDRDNVAQCNVGCFEKIDNLILFSRSGCAQTSSNEPCCDCCHLPYFIQSIQRRGRILNFFSDSIALTVGCLCRSSWLKCSPFWANWRSNVCCTPIQTTPTTPLRPLCCVATSIRCRFPTCTPPRPTRAAPHCFLRRFRFIETGRINLRLCDARYL